MDYLVRIAVFWVAVCAAILLLNRFPGSPLARIAFARLGPQPVAGEPRSRYLRRWAACAGTWFAQAASIWTACAIAWHLDPALGQSMGFLVFWLIVVSLLGAIAGTAALVALVASLLGRARRAVRESAAA